MAKPVVSYPGAKWRFYPHMVDYFPLDMKVFIEPFFGGGSVSLSVADDPRFTKLERMIGGDLYTEMWSLWQGIKEDPAAVEEIATKWFTDMCPHQKEIHDLNFVGSEARLWLPGGENEDFESSDIFGKVDLTAPLDEQEDVKRYIAEQRQKIRDNIALYNLACQEGQNFWNWSQTVDTSQMTTLERAARMILVNKISFSGMGDAGSLSKDQFCDFTLDKLQSMYDAHRLLQRIELLNVSFEDTMKFGNEGNPDDNFIFLDPPYAKQEDSGLYGKGGSTHRGFPHQHFADFTKAMKCKWFVTYDDSVIVRKLFAGNTYFGTPCYFKPFTIPGGYTLAGKTDEDALAGEELFISNYNINTVNDVADEDF
ncbi:MAG: DNA adenine methylase [Lachnospiraceae bacterium]|nr:DNA adenine methylase [Lachnospiraceae bacterium]